MGVSVTMYNNWIRRFGLTFKNTFKKKYPLDDKVTALVHEEGYSITDACAECGVEMSGYRWRAIANGDLVPRRSKSNT